MYLFVLNTYTHLCVCVCLYVCVFVYVWVYVCVYMYVSVNNNERHGKLGTWVSPSGRRVVVYLPISFPYLYLPLQLLVAKLFYSY